MTASFRLEGFRELDHTLGQLPKATAKNTLKRVLTKAAVPVEDAAQAAAPKDTARLERSIVVGTQLTKSQKQGSTQFIAGIGFLSAHTNVVTVHIGTVLSRGMFTNFGTFKDVPQLWFDRAWSATHAEALGIIESSLGAEIEKSAKRYAKKLAKGA